MARFVFSRAVTDRNDRKLTSAQLFAVGFHSKEADDNITSLIRDYHVGAIVLFKRNVRDAAQLRKLCLDLQQIAKAAGHEQPLFIGIDQENGLVTRISPPIATQLPGPMALGAVATEGENDAYKVAGATGKMLRHFGINMNYAPVGDINSEPLNPVIGTRSPGDNPATVARFANACAKGLREVNVVPCIKHFPGHGDTAVDSHYGLPVIDKSRARMEEVELVPFKEAVREGIEMVMTAHISLPQLTGNDLPATLSPATMDILRKELGFEGVVMTDCLEMDGIRATYGTVEGTVMAFQAGVDNVMICHTYDVQTAAIDRLCAAVESGEISKSRIDLSLDRLAKLKKKFTTWDEALQQQDPAELEALNQDSAKLAEMVYARSATVVRSRTGTLALPRDASTIFLSPGPNVPVGGGGAVDSGDPPTRVPWTSSTFGDALRRYNPSVTDIRYTETGLSEEQWSQISSTEVVVVATRNAKEAAWQDELGREVARRRRARDEAGEARTVHVATCNPYDFLDVQEIETYVAVYEPTLEAFRAAVDVLYGEREAAGRLPVAH